jgi:hypothetical protein
MRVQLVRVCVSVSGLGGKLALKYRHVTVAEAHHHSTINLPFMFGLDMTSPLAEQQRRNCEAKRHSQKAQAALNDCCI